MKKRNETLGSGGGYTRVIKLADRRLGDGGQLAILQLVSEDDKPRKGSKDKTERKRRARVKYTVYAGKPRPHRGKRRSAKAPATGSKAAEPEAGSEANKTE